MKSGKGHQEYEEEEDDDFRTKKDGLPSNSNTKDGKNSDKANAMRSKHSVTEQRRRSKINERFQVLRELIPNSDQKRDTASFLLEVIQYVQFLQEKVEKYEGSYQPWSSEPTKLMPWRNSQWRVQSLAGLPQAAKNGSSFPVQQNNPIETDPIRVSSSRSIDQQTENQNKSISIPITNDGGFLPLLAGPTSEAQSIERPTTAHVLNGQDELTIEGGTISISSVYSHGLLSSLAQALESTGMDLSQASISVQVNLGNRANRGPTPEASIAKDHDMKQPPIRPARDPSNAEDSDQPQKRLKI